MDILSLVAFYILGSFISTLLITKDWYQFKTVLFHILAFSVIIQVYSYAQ